MCADITALGPLTIHVSLRFTGVITIKNNK